MFYNLFVLSITGNLGKFQAFKMNVSSVCVCRKTFLMFEWINKSKQIYTKNSENNFVACMEWTIIKYIT